MFSCTEAYRVENGSVGAPVKGATLIGDGRDGAAATSAPSAMTWRSIPGIGNCGKAGQWVPVGVGQPTLMIGGLTVGGIGGVKGCRGGERIFAGASAGARIATLC